MYSSLILSITLEREHKKQQQSDNNSAAGALANE
jgi:hypothetical protein